MRAGDIVVYAVGDDAAFSALSGWCRLAAGRAANERLADLKRLTDGASTLGAFAAIMLDEGGADVVIAGGVPLRAQTHQGERELGPGRSRLDDFSAVNLLFAESVLDANLSLGDGVVAADGFSLRRSVDVPLPWGEPAKTAPAPREVPEAAPAPEPPAPRWPAPDAAPVATPEPAPAPPVAASPPEPESSPPGIVSLRDPVAETPRRPLPVTPPAAPAPEPPSVAPPAVADLPAVEGGVSRTFQPAPAPVKVKGLVCSRGHFNDPRTRFCAVCGIAMHQASLILTEDERPALGVLAMSDGNVYTLVTSLVFGREPGADDEVRAGRAQGVQLIDPANTISRVHAEIRAVEWDVQLIDQGSLNGTFVWAPDRQQWDRVTPHQPVMLQPGTHLSFGRLTATFQSGNRQKG